LLLLWQTDNAVLGMAESKEKPVVTALCSGTTRKAAYFVVNKLQGFNYSHATAGTLCCT